MKHLRLMIYTLLAVFLLPWQAVAQTTVTGPSVINGQMTAPITWGGPSGCVYNWFNPTPGIGLPTSGSGDIASFKALNPTSTPITVTITATPTPRPVYAYIPSQATNRVTVINTDDYSVVTQIRVGNKPYGVAVSKDGTRVYVSNSNSNSVSVIDAASNTVISTIPVGKNPMALDISPDGTRLYVANHDDQNIYVIDTTDPLYSYKLVPYPGKPIALTVKNDGSGGVYIAGGGLVHEYQPFTNMLRPIFDSRGDDTHQILFSPDGLTAYFVCFAISRDALDNERLIYQQTYARVNTQTYQLEHINAGIADVNFGGALSADGTRFYMSYPADNAISVVNTLNNRPLDQFNVGQNPNGIAMTQKGILFVINQDSNDIWAIEPLSNTILRKIPFTDTQPFALGNFITGITCTSSTPIQYAFTILPTPPTIVVEGTPDVLTTPANIPSQSTYVDVSGINLTEGIATAFTAQSGFEMSLDDKSYSAAPIVIGNGGTPPPVHLYIRIAAGNPVGPLNGTITLKSAGADDKQITVSGTVTPAIPYVIAGTAGGNITACEGNPSASPKLQQFTVSGTLLTDNINLTAPTNFEISRDPNSGFGNAISIPPTGGTVAGTTIYVRSAASAKGVITGNVNIQSAGATTLMVAVNGVVAAPPKVDPVPPPQTRFAGQNTAAINFTGTATSYSWTNDKPEIGLAASGDGNIPAFKTINKGNTDITATITVTPHNDPLAYVALLDQNAVSVINTLTGKVVNIIGVAQKPYATAVSPDGTTVYVANQNSGLVSIINTTANKVVGNITVGSNPSGMALSPDGNTLYVTNGNASTVQLFDANSHAVLGSRAVGITPQGVAVSPNSSFAYVANRNSNTVSVISPVLPTKLLDIGVGTSPEELIVSPDGTTVYVTNYNSASVSVISTADNKRVDDILVGSNPRGITISKDGSTLYVTNYGSKSVTVIRTSDKKIIKTVTVGTNPEGISISPDGKLVYVANYGSNNVTVINTIDNSVNTTIGLAGSPVSFGDFIVAGTGCAGSSVTFTITVKAAVQHIFPTGTLTPLNTTYGTPSGAITFNVSGADMTDGILVTPPSGFEVSADGSTFGKTATVGSAGNIPSSTVSIRLAATTPVGNNYAGDVVLSSNNVPDASIATAKSAVTKAQLTVTADDQQRNYGQDNPTLTAKYDHFVNGEDETVLTALPTISTTATKTSAPGTYPITVSGGVADNYTIDPKPGTLTVTDTKGISPVIPNAFSPNGDGVNDTWKIKNLETFPTCTVDIYTRSGQQVYHSVGYATPWDGKYSGANLPAGVYYYVINLNNGSSPLSGYVAVIR